MFRDHTKVIHHFNHRSLETFDLQADPGERERLSNYDGEGPRMVSLMRGWLSDRWKVFDTRLQQTGVETLEIDQESEDALRALGYIQ